MSAANQPTPPPKVPPKQSGTLLAAIVVAVVLMLFGCGGACAGFLYLTVPRARQAMQQTNLPLPNLPMPTTMVSPAANDWMTTRMLSEVYTRSLAVVAADKQVIEHLGEPVETNLEADDLYRRKDNADITRGGAEIEYDILGPRGTGIVTVEIKDQTNIAKLTVKLPSGITLDLPPPEPQSFMVR